MEAIIVSKLKNVWKKGIRKTMRKMDAGTPVPQRRPVPPAGLQNNGPGGPLGPIYPLRACGRPRRVRQVRCFSSKIVFLLQDVCMFSMCLVEFVQSYRAEGSPGIPGRTSKKSTFFSNRFLIGFSLVFDSPLGSIFDDFLCFLHHFFEYEICIDFASILGWIWISFLMFF